ncbi:uncharacterized protein FIESC28_00754 [Fusarium coffeatum]|uniref:F-box domain-containing protein n=1 Tax=Fusarium coffeatum TaxID=231269 RepID=A0A366SCK2_9HYPO|nr:uncharacterized protein FIESC28_00754 [Fusarium coffeatum]RBR26460.1 hypothetical protein FIESC28_00754 [Fusarium coffeatum]
MTSYLLQLPRELQDAIFTILKPDDIKNLRVTCITLAKALPLHFNRVFISANSLNIQVFNAIANHEVFRHQVSEIIWDDARLLAGFELAWGDNSDTQDGVPLWFIEGRSDYGDRGHYVYPKNHLGIKESWAYYKPLLDDQQQVLASNLDLEAFKFGLRQFTSLKRVTITPATHGTHWRTLYRTPMIRAFPPGLDYPLPKAWPYFDDDLKIDVLPWVSDGDDRLHQEIYDNVCTTEEYRAKWRGFQLVIRALAEFEDHGITELVIGGHEIQSGLNARLFDEWSPEYGDLVTLLKRPGFRHLELHLFTGFVLEDHKCFSYRSGLLRDALAHAEDLEYLSLRASTYIENGVPELLTFEDEEDWCMCPLQDIFPVDQWPRLQHFGISNMLVDREDLIGLLASLPPSLRSVELSHLGLKSPHEYSDLVRDVRDVLDWQSRAPGKRPQSGSIKVNTVLVCYGRTTAVNTMHLSLFIRPYKMRVTATFGSLIVGASLCAARACAPHPRSTTTSSLISEIGTTTAESSATTTTSLSATEAESSIESSVIIETSTVESATTELDSTTSDSETLTVTESETSAESSATTTDGISSFTTIVASTTAITFEDTETSTSVDEATTTTVEATTTTAGPPVITNLVQNGGFEDATIDPWVVEGAPSRITNDAFAPEGSQLLRLDGDLANSAKVCQRVEVEAGFEYTFKAQVAQYCIKSFGSNIVMCDDDVNTVQLSIAGVYVSGDRGIVGYNIFNEYTYTFSYTGPSIDSTDLCITISQNQGIGPVFYLDGVSLTRGRAVPIPTPTDP